MPYVSARYAPLDEIMPAMPGAPKRVVATDDQGREWWLTEDSQVGDWLRYVEEGGQVTPYVAAPETKPAEEPVP
jgi:hypothetical protein